MADDGFTAPLGDFRPPSAEASPAALYDQLTLMATYAAPGDALQVDPGCASRDEGAQWIPMVIARTGRADLYMSPATAREIAVRVAGNLLFSVVYGDAVQVGRLFSAAADQAEALAAGQGRLSTEEMH